MIEVGLLSPSTALITGGDALRAWREAHCLPVPGHEHDPRFRHGRWDGTWTPGRCVVSGDKTELRISRGLVPRIVKDLGLDLSFDFSGLSSAEVDAFFAEHEETFSGFRDYQTLITRLVLMEGWGRAAFATNAGKGAVIGMLARFARDRDYPVLILCDELGVFDALQGEVLRWGGFEPGVIKRGMKEPPESLVTLAMVPTLARRIKAERLSKRKRRGPWTTWLESIQMILLDEADKGASDSWRGILAAAKNTIWRAGFSGTFKEDIYHGTRFDELMGPILHRVPNMELVERGISARPTVEVHRFDGTSKLYPLPRPRAWWAMGTGRRRMVYERTIIRNEERHAFVASLVQPNTPTAIIVNRVEHGQALAEIIPGAAFLDGSVENKTRLSVLTDFQEGRVDVLVVTKILDRGTNRLGRAADLIFASGEGSTTQTLQRIGRGLRRTDGKEFLRLVDIADRVAVYPRGDKSATVAARILAAAVRRRLETYSKEGFDVELHK